MPVAGQKGSEKDACKTEACSIQTCLSKNGYNVSQCSHQVDRLKKCCEKHQGTSVHCGWDPEGLQGSAAGEPADQAFHGR